MLSGLSFLQMQLDQKQKVKYNMSWMVAHSFVGSLGLEDSKMLGRCVTCIVSMWQGSMVLQLSSSMVKSKVPQRIWHTRGELEEKPWHLSHFRMIWNWPWRKATSCLIQATMLNRYLQKVGCQTHHFQADADLIPHSSRGRRHWSSYFIMLLYRNERWRTNFFSLISELFLLRWDVSEMTVFILKVPVRYW